MPKKLAEGLDDVEVPDDLEAVELDGLDDDLDPVLDDDVDVDAVLDDDVDPVLDDEVDDDAVVAVVEADDDDDEEEEDDDEMEAGLDVILKDRLVVSDDEDDEDDDEEAVDADDRNEATTKVLPKRPGEFVCSSCLLVKHPAQLVDPDRILCRDCA